MKKPRPEADLERRIGGLVFRLNQAGKHNASAVSREFGLTGPQSHLFIHLDPANPVTMVALAVALDCDPSNITGLVDKLEMKGYIQRRPDSKDRRVKMIAVTEAGTKVRARLLARLSQPPRAIALLSQTDKKILYRILKDLVDPADSTRNAEDGIRPAPAERHGSQRIGARPRGVLPGMQILR
jgi:MarR family transcriptional regulator, organic hydroperoxide resistance regulator